MSTFNPNDVSSFFDNGRDQFPEGHEYKSPAPDTAEIKADNQSFEAELEGLINKHSKENESNTPDFILAQFMAGCLNLFNQASRGREKWYGKELKINY